MQAIQNAHGAKILRKRKMMEIMLQVRRQAGDIVARVDADGIELQQQENKHGLRPVVAHKECAQGVGEEIREDVLGHGAVRCREPDWCCEFVVLFVEELVEGAVVEGAVDVVEAYLGAGYVEQ